MLTAACGSVARPQGWAAPLVQDDTLYLTLQHGKLEAYRLTPQRERLWEFPGSDTKVPLVVEQGKDLSTPKSAKLTFEGLYGDPVLAGDSIYATAYSGHVIALDTGGNARWVAQLPGRMTGGVLADDDAVYAGTTSGDLFALGRADGKVRWKQSGGDGIWSAPIRIGDSIVVADMAGRVTAYDRSGNRRWSAKVASGAIASTPAVNGDTLYLGSFDKRMYAVDGRTGSTTWQSAAADNWFWTQPLIQGDTLFAGSLGGTMYAFDAANGTTRWSTPLGSMIRSRPVVLGSTLIVGTRDGRLHGLEPASGASAWETPNAPAPDDPTAPRGDLFADLVPTKDRGGVYVSTTNKSSAKLYVLDLADRKVKEIALQ